MVFELLTAFGLGILSTSNPCALPLYPGFIAYLAGANRRDMKSLLGLAVAGGVISSMLFLGLVLDLFAVSLGRLLTLATPVVAGIIALLGLMMIFNVNPFVRAAFPIRASFGKPFVRAFLYGMLYGPVSIPCIAPLLFSVVASSLLFAERLSRISYFISFGTGLSLPLFVIALLTDALADRYVAAVTRYHRLLIVAGGLILLVIAGYSFLNLYVYGRYYL